MSKTIKSRFIIALALAAKIIVTLVFFAALPACATKPATFSQKDPRADLYAFKTLAFFAPAPAQRGRAGYASLVDETIRAPGREVFANYPRKA